MVISALEQRVGKDRIRWETAVVPDKPFVELWITYDPTELDHLTIATAMKAAMEAHPDPAHPGPVQLVVQEP